MPLREEIEEQLSLLDIYRRRITYQLQQRATFGPQTPFSIVEDIREARDKIKRIKNTLRGWDLVVDDHSNDDPPDRLLSSAPVCQPPNATRLFGRDSVITAITSQLINSTQDISISAIRGLPGVGKTDLLRAVGCDARVQEYFTGGVLYAELGPSANLVQWLRRWIIALGQEPPKTDDDIALSEALRASLRDRQALLILDDVWESSLRIAKRLRDCRSSNCRVLASSRSAHIAQEVARGAPPLMLDVLVPASALDLLRHSARDGDADIVALNEASAVDLCDALGYLPLALKLAGGWLRANYRKPDCREHPCAALLAAWRKQIDELHGYEERPNQASDQLSLDAIIGLSYVALPNDLSRQAADALAAFGATPLDWDWEAMIAVWQSDAPTTARLEHALVMSGLLGYNVATGRYSLHQTISAFVEQRAAPGSYKAHAEYYAALLKHWGMDVMLYLKGDVEIAIATLDREIRQMERGQQCAVRHSHDPEWDKLLIRYAGGCAAYFDMRGHYAQKIAWSEVAHAAALRLGHKRDAAAMRHNIAVIYRNIGRYAEAIDAHTEAFNIFQDNGYEMEASITLVNLGIIRQLQKQYDDAIGYYIRSLEIVHRLNDKLNIARTLGNLGSVHIDMGQYDKGIEYHKQSLDIKREINDVAGTALTLGNLGSAYQAKGDFDRAITYLRESLSISRRINSAMPLADGLYNLGTLYETQGNFAEAYPLLEEAVSIAARLESPRLGEWQAKAQAVQDRLNNYH
jgi:tetratricopeptide (TPR) repeat protein